MMKTLMLFKGRNKHLVGMGLLSLLFMFFAVKVSAQRADFSLFPATTNVIVDQTFTIEVRVDLDQSTNTQVDVAEAYLNFDPTYLEVVSISGGNSFNLVTVNNFSNTAGTADYAAGTNGAPITTDFTLYTVTFRAKALPPVGTTSITFNTDLPRQTNAIRSGVALPGTRTGATINVTANAPLPVKFSDFSAATEENNVVLRWTTATEINNKGFEIQRSVDRSSWIVLGFVNGAGNTVDQKKYNYTDTKLAPGHYYYRVKQQDHDGKFEYSQVVSIIFGGSKFSELGQNQPNPFSGRTSLNFSVAEKTKVTLTLFDAQGRLVKTLLNETKDAGTHIIDLNLHTLKSGIYYYKMVAGNFTAVKNLVVQ
jgi:hypothetical protein